MKGDAKSTGEETFAVPAAGEMALAYPQVPTRPSPRSSTRQNGLNLD